jgi:hypothetical protein
LSGLVDQLLEESLKRSVPITDLLRKAKTAAVKLNRADFAAWTDQEMSGYGAAGEIPAYRRLHCELKFMTPMRGWCPIFGSHENIDTRQPISGIVSLLEGKETFFISSVSPEMVKHYSAQLGVLVDVKRHISRAALASVIEAVRDAVHNWALELWQAGIQGEGMSF